MLGVRFGSVVVDQYRASAMRAPVDISGCPELVMAA